MCVSYITIPAYIIVTLNDLSCFVLQKTRRSLTVNTMYDDV